MRCLTSLTCEVWPPARLSRWKATTQPVPLYRSSNRWLQPGPRAILLPAKAGRGAMPRLSIDARETSLIADLMETFRASTEWPIPYLALNQLGNLIGADVV